MAKQLYKKNHKKRIEKTKYKETDIIFSFKLDINLNFKKPYFIIKNLRKNKYQSNVRQNIRGVVAKVKY